MATQKRNGSTMGKMQKRLTYLSARGAMFAIGILFSGMLHAQQVDSMEIMEILEILEIMEIMEILEIMEIIQTYYLQQWKSWKS
jgi:hypothetical protein